MRPFPIQFPLPRKRFFSVAAFVAFPLTLAAQTDHAAVYEKEILPILEDHCYSCHGDGEDKGKVTFDTFGSTTELMNQPELWVHVLKNIRGGLMPPEKKDRIPSEDFAKLEQWIKSGPLKLDPANPDPGRVTLRRLNRVEYRNTIRDLMGIDFRTDEEFPADDTGYGFDTIGDVLTTSPLLLEKYMQAAEAIVAKAVPLQSKVTPQRTIPARKFTGRDGYEMSVSLYDPADVSTEIEIRKPGTYRVVLNAQIRGSFAFDPGRADAEWFVDGKRVFQQELKWEDGMKLDSSVEVKWEKGSYPLRFAMKPLVGKDKKPAERPGDGPPNVDLKFRGVTLIGPLEPEFAERPENYNRFFTREEVPQNEAGKLDYTKEILRRFITRAFRRPADERTVERLSGLAMESASAPGSSFERGIARALTAVLASPRFLFRMEETLSEADPKAHPLLDEYALASRLSYFLWSTMPDETLYQLAEKGELRKNLSSQVARMLEDGRSDEFVSNFAGQWLQTRDVESVSIDARVVLARDAGQEKDMRERFEKFRRLNREIDEAEKNHDTAKIEELKKERAEMRAKFGNGGRRIEFGGSLRTAMKREAEMLFRHLLRTDGSVLDLVDNDSTFLNEELANHYGVPGVQGGDMRLVKLPPDSPRGGVITMGTVLAVTSNPTRTSPVKRGLFILDNILGTPPPPAPPNIASLEASEKTENGDDRTLREALALHREQPLCSSCHNRMDPLGLALENFNAMGSWRDKERGQQLEPPSGKLITGEKFADVKELKRLLVTARRTDYYRCLTEKLLTYSLGRGPQPCDISTVDAVVENLEQNHGKFSSLILGIIESPAFQRRQRTTL
jgi:mono/diheme cytochrome c family protein